jgi:hypothetical protein
MKLVTAIAAAALIFGVTAASAQTPTSSASKPGSTTNTDKEVPAVTGTKATDPSSTGMKPATTGSSASGTVGGTSPNPTTNKNPDTEVPGKKQ